MRALGSLLGLAAACAAPARTPPEVARDRDRIAIVIAERGDTGARLVAIDERGDRRLEVVKPSETLARDTNPAISPDGRWLVFASSRDRSIEDTSLWIAPLEPEAAPTRLTTGPAIDSHPAWTHDGRAIVFASTRGGGGFDLYELAIDARGRAAGEPRRLTSTPDHEVTPTIAADGTIIYAKITPRPDGQVESHLEARAPDGTITPLTNGPGDTSPALSPDGQTIAFARPIVHHDTPDADLFVVARAGETARPARQLVDVPVADESGPTWSRDGRFVLATSVLRGARGNVLFSSVIVVDTHDVRPTARILQDRTGAIARLTPEVAAADLDAKALDADPEYLPELARIAADAIAAQKQQEAPK